MANQNDETVRGKTIRWTFIDGPMKGSTYEHTFGKDGSVVWRSADAAGKAKSTRDKGSAKQTSEPKAEYAVLPIADDVCAISYLAASGYTLTVVLNFKDNRLVGFASNEKEWYPLKGTFEIVEKSRSVAH